jgi:hypothetical protein
MSDIDSSRAQIAVLRVRISELEAALDNSRKECGKALELNAKLQFDLQEVCWIVSGTTLVFVFSNSMISLTKLISVY